MFCLVGVLLCLSRSRARVTASAARSRWGGHSRPDSVPRTGLRFGPPSVRAARDAGPRRLARPPSTTRGGRGHERRRARAASGNGSRSQAPADGARSDRVRSDRTRPRPVRRRVGAGLPRAPDRRRLPDPAGPRRARARLRARAAARSSSSRSSSSCSSCRRSCSAPRYFTPIRDFKANLRPIALLAVGLVLFTTVVVGASLQLLVPGHAWAAAFALGAIVAPPDAVAATAIFRRLGVPRADRDDPRGREPGQRRDGARRLPRRGRWRRSTRRVLARRTPAPRSSSSAVGGIAVGLVVGWLVTELRGAGSTTRRSRSCSRCSPRSRPTCRPRRSASAACSRRSSAGLIAGQRAARDPVARRAAAGHGRLAGRPLHDQRVRVHPHRAAAAGRSSPSLGRPTRSELVGHRAGDQPDRRSWPGSCGSSRRPTCRAGSAPASARAIRPAPPRRSSSSRGRACAASSRWPRRSPCR